LFEGLKDSEKKEAAALFHELPNLQSRQQTLAPLRQSCGQSPDCFASDLVSFDSAFSSPLKISSIAYDNSSQIPLCQRISVFNNQVHQNSWQTKNDSICEEHHESRLEEALWSFWIFRKLNKTTFDNKHDDSRRLSLCKFQKKTTTEAETSRLL